MEGFYNIDEKGDYYLTEDGTIIRSLPWTEMIVLSFAITFIIVVLLIYRIRGNNKLDYKESRY